MERWAAEGGAVGPRHIPEKAPVVGHQARARLKWPGGMDPSLPHLDSPMQRLLAATGEALSLPSTAGTSNTTLLCSVRVTSKVMSS